MSLLSLKAGTRRRAAGAGVACILGALAATYASAEVGHETAAAANLGSLSVTPATGDTNTASVAFGTEAPCGEGATSFLVQMAGPGVPETGANALGTNDIAVPGVKIDHYPMGATWAGVATAQGLPMPLSGTYNLKLICLVAGAPADDFTTSVTFTPTIGQDSTYTAGTGAGGSPSPAPSESPSAGTTPSPSPSTSATPTPSTTPAPSTTATPTPSSTASPSPSASASPSPSSTTTPTSTTTPSGTVTPASTTTNGVGGGALPKTGAESRSLLILAALLLVCGAFLLALSSVADPEVRDL